MSRPTDAQLRMEAYRQIESGLVQAKQLDLDSLVCGEVRHVEGSDSAFVTVAMRVQYADVQVDGEA